MKINTIIHAIKNNKKLTDEMIEFIKQMNQEDKMIIIETYNISLVALTKLRNFFIF